MYSNQFLEAWEQYPRKIGKAAAFKKFNIALKRDGYEAILNGIRSYTAYTATTEKQYIKHFATFLHGQCYLDTEYDTERNEPKKTTSNGVRQSQISNAMAAATKTVQKNRTVCDMGPGYDHHDHELPF